MLLNDDVSKTWNEKMLFCCVFCLEQRANPWPQRFEQRSGVTSKEDYGECGFNFDKRCETRPTNHLQHCLICLSQLYKGVTMNLTMTY